MHPHELPVYQERDRILAALQEHQVIVVESPTGSGKTTQLPILLHEAGYDQQGVIGVTQPRRIAAVSVSEYIARQLDCNVGEQVGYKMRFEDRTSPATRMKIMTDGILLQEMKLDYSLRDYSVVIVDEAHERSLNIDFILGLLKRVLAMRKQFKVIISSATINAEIFSEYFDSCPIVRIETPMHPVQVIYDPPEIESNYDALVDKVIQVVARVVKEHYEGDILIFLSGERLIKDCIAGLYMQPFRRRLDIRPLYGRLSKDEQEAVFPPAASGKIKVVVSTNIAETSVTIDGITTVIDSGLAKTNFYNPKTYTSSLVEGPISKAGANQRRGRAGRTQPGRCYRLYGREDYETRQLFGVEEIYRTDLSEVVLRMAEIGITDFDSFDFISSPGRQGIIAAVETLHLFEALTPQNELSSIGRMMAEFPLLPRHSRMIVEAIRTYPEVVMETVVAASFLTTNTPFVLPQGEEIEARRAHHRYRDDLGDFVSYLKLLQAYSDAPNKEQFCESRYLDSQTMAEIANIRDQLAEIVGAMGIPVLSGGSRADYLCSIAKGLIQFVCAGTGRGRYRSLTAEQIQIHPGSVMYRGTPQFIVAGEIVRTTRTYARSVSPLRPEWLARISPQLAKDLAGTKAARVGKQRDTTWQISIGSRMFQLKSFKGKKKIAVLPWDELRRALDENPAVIGPFNNLKGKIVYQGYEIMPGAKVTELIRIAQLIDPPHQMMQHFPRQNSFDVELQSRELCLHLDDLLKLTPLKKTSKNVGFISLQTDGAGRYWFKTQRALDTAAAESLAGLEVLADELTDDADDQSVEAVNRTYRRLNGAL